MLIDLNDASAPKLLETEICVVGCGAAGVALARKLAHSMNIHPNAAAAVAI